jgi:preprotein translocase subunit SecE
MNTMAEQFESGTSAGDWLKYIGALLLVAAGIFVFYYFAEWNAVVRGLIVAAAVGGALFIAAFSKLGNQAREFVSESMFEMRKVVWPTRQEAWRITLVVLVVVVLIGLILAGFDYVISHAVQWLLKA